MPQSTLSISKLCFIPLTLCLLLAPARAENNGNIYDPWESYNRTVFDFNHKLEKNLVRPVAKLWRKTPESVQESATNFFRNLETPWIIMNNVLQGEGQKAGDNTVRFVGNTVFGVFGLFDVVSHQGPQYDPADLGQTLAKWGVGEGPIFVVPIIGTPKPMRAVASSGIEQLTNPIVNAHSTSTKNQVFVGQVINNDANAMDVIESTEASSQDLYITTRSMLVQQRRAFVSGNELTIDDEEDDPFADFDDDMSEDPSDSQ